jgi:hypothetical protein
MPAGRPPTRKQRAAYRRKVLEIAAIAPHDREPFEATRPSLGDTSFGDRPHDFYREPLRGRRRAKHLMDELGLRTGQASAAAQAGDEGAAAACSLYFEWQSRVQLAYPHSTRPRHGGGPMTEWVAVIAGAITMAAALACALDLL